MAKQTVETGGGALGVAAGASATAREARALPERGTHAYAVIADEVFHEVCEEFGSEMVTAEELYRKHASSIKWGELPKEGTDREIRKVAREAMEKTLLRAEATEGRPLEKAAVKKGE